jgi:hypothetical protein
MLSEQEISALIDDPALLESIQNVKKDFKEHEAPYLEISDHDFFCLILLMPNVKIALAKGSISLLEEMALQKKARMVSKGGYFLKKDPVVYALKFLIPSAGKWEDKFFDVICMAMNQAIDIASIRKVQDGFEKIHSPNFDKLVFKAPYIFIRFMQTFFWDENFYVPDEQRFISQIEFEQLVKTGKRLKIENTIIFRKFLANFIVNK